MPREASFNFIPSHQIKNTIDIDLHATISIKHSKITFSAKSYMTKELAGKFIKFFIDAEKNTLAFRILEENSLGSMREYRKIKICERSKATSCSIPKICIESLKTTETSYKKILVKTYKPTGLLAGEIYHYMTLK